MEQSLQLHPFPSFDYDSDKANAGVRWSKWMDRLENLFVALNITDDKRLRALLLHYAGETVYDIYQAENGATGDTYDETKKVLKDYFDPRTNIQIEIYKFRMCKQKPGQSLDDYVNELRQLAKNCQFADMNKEILSQVIQYCLSNRFRRRAHRELDKDLPQILEMGRSFEVTEMQAAAMERDTVSTIETEQMSEGVANINFHRNKRTRPKQSKPHFANTNKTSQNQSSHSKQHKQCVFCGSSYPHTGPCPTKCKTCNYCKKENHFARVCIQLQKSGMHSTADRYQNRVSKIQESDHYAHLCPQCSAITPDRATCDGTYAKVALDSSSSDDDYTYSITASNTVCECDIVIETLQQIQYHPFHVVCGTSGSLIGYNAAQQLGLVKILNNITDIKDNPKLYQGIGKLKYVTVKLHIDDSVKPVAQKHRRTLFHLRNKVEAELNKLLEQDIIEKVGGVPTPWISPIVTPPKKDSDEIRICIDMRAANHAILRERHNTPTISEIITNLNGANVFSKLDLRSGYHQLELDSDSRSITTFSTHLGLFRYKRLNFGISSASEVFQETIRNVIHDIPNTKNISDDIIVFGRTQSEHDIALSATLQRLYESGLTLNKNKCVYNKNSINFFGLVFSEAGGAPDPNKVQAIRDSERPTSVSEVKSLLGMLNYSARFIHDYATASEPLQRLTKKDEPWTWSDEQETAFQILKDRLAESTVMSYFDPDKDIEIIVDASPVGLGGMLVQENRVIVYASRALSDVESRCSQTEHEAPAVVWACEHFDMYVNRAQHFVVVTDHKPLEKIWTKPKPPLRIERWGMRLLPYKFTITYRPGNKNPADYLSRHPTCATEVSHEQKFTKQYVNQTSVPIALKLEDIKDALSRHKTLQKVIELVRTGRWLEIKTLHEPDINLDELYDFNNIRDEFTYNNDNVLLRGHLIVIPSELRDRAVALAHERHQGISCTKAFIRSKIWFPGINDKVEKTVKKLHSLPIYYYLKYK